VFLTHGLIYIRSRAGAAGFLVLPGQLFSVLEFFLGLFLYDSEKQNATGNQTKKSAGIYFLTLIQSRGVKQSSIQGVLLQGTNLNTQSNTLWGGENMFSPKCQTNHIFSARFFAPPPRFYLSGHPPNLQSEAWRKAEARVCLANTSLLFIGDSMTRSFF